jgi:hypothetical protein
LSVYHHHPQTPLNSSNGCQRSQVFTKFFVKTVRNVNRTYGRPF